VRAQGNFLVRGSRVELVGSPLQLQVEDGRLLAGRLAFAAGGAR
jgi:hypothetical protein